MGIEFNNDQIYCIYDLENWYQHNTEQVYNISGSPGTGKTTIIRYFIERLGLGKHEVAFLAYMGKASMVMARNGLPAQTIHSFIYDCLRVPEKDAEGKYVYTPKGKLKMKFVFQKKDRLPKKVKLLVIDEAGCVPENIAQDLLSYNIPIIALGDLNQLPPVFGNSFFLKDPNYVLTQIMRQAENDPIVWLSQRVLEGKRLQNGIYGKSLVADKRDLSVPALKKTDIVLTSTNMLRNQINLLFREDIYQYRQLDIPHVGEKVVCRRNNFSREIDGNIYLTNGMTGTIDYVATESLTSDSITIDFKPDFTEKKFKNLKINYHRLMNLDYEDNKTSSLKFGLNEFEYGYAITVHLSQGSQYDKVIVLDEPSAFDKLTKKKLLYTAITRATESISIYH